MIRNKDDFKTEYKRLANAMFRRDPEHLTDDRDKFAVLARLVEQEANERANAVEILSAQKKKKEDKRVYYFSMEFLIGKLMENYLLNLGILDEAKEAFADYGKDLNKVLDTEPDPGLGNGGLGRLAACFLDSMAALGIKGDGMGLRYKFGLFKQNIESGYQIELPDAWLDEGYV